MTDHPLQPSLDLIDLLTKFDRTVPPCPTCGAKLYWHAPGDLDKPVRIWCEQCGYEIRGREPGS